jgi:hypothetical protein
MAHMQLLLAPTIATSILTTVAHRYLPHSSDRQVACCYWTGSSDVLYDSSGLSLLDGAVAMA